MKKIVGIIIIWLTVVNATAWADIANDKPAPCRPKIFLDRYDSVFQVNKTIDTLAINEYRYLIITLSDCSGTLYLQERMTSNNKMIFEGNYIAAKDSFYIETTVSAKGKQSVENIRFFVPQRHGMWKYLDCTTNIRRQEMYEIGRLLE